MNLASWTVLFLSAGALECQIASAQVSPSVTRLARAAGTAMEAPCCECGKGFRAGRTPTPTESSEPVCVSSKVMRSLVVHIRPLEPPCCGENVNISGRVVVEVLVDAEGKVKCARALRGHPFAITSAIDAVPKWTFRPYHVRGVPRLVCGNITIKFRFQDKSASTELR
jgi:TonB family protein